MKRFKNSSDLAHALGLPKERGELAELKSKLTKEIIKSIETQKLTHQELSDMSGISRSAITGIVSGSLQKVTLDRLLRLIWALGLRIEMKVKSAA